jgi:N-acetylneuraminate synthase
MSLFFIAEIGINHNGDLDTAKKMIDMAKACGCDAVKFQKRTIDTVYTPEFLSQKRESPWGTTQRDQKEGLELSEDEYREIDRYCKESRIPWFASSWDCASQNFLRRFDLPYNKIASAMLTHDPLVNMVAEEGKHTFISTGMSNLMQIEMVVDLFREKKCPFTLMHAISVYPCKDEECNLKMIPELQTLFRCNVGYSGHETGLLPSIVAVTLGATVIERHITLNRCAYGSDQAASLEKHGLEVLVRDLRLIKQAMGTGEKTISESELKTMRSLRYFDDTWRDPGKRRLKGNPWQEHKNACR